MAGSYNAGIVTAYGAAVSGGYTGTYEQFCAQQANYAQTAAAVEQAKTDAQAAAQRAQDVAESIPEDYTELTEEVGNLKEELFDYAEGIENLGFIGAFVRGSLSAGAWQSCNYRVCSDDAITFNKRTTLTITNGFKIGVHFFVNGSFNRDSGWQQSSYIIPAESTVKIVIARVTEVYSEVADIHEFVQSVTFESEAEITKNIVDDVLITIDKSINLLNPNTLTANSVFKDDGTLNTSSQWYSAYSVSDFIDVSDHIGEYIYNTYGNDTTANNRNWMSLYGYCFYGADKSTVISINKTFTGNNFQVPTGAKYVRVCSQTTLINTNGMTYFGTGKVDYVEFYENVVPADRARVIALEEEVSEMKAPTVVLFPNTIYGVVGHPFSIYYYNIIKCDSLEGYHAFISPASAEVQNLGDRIRFKCTTAGDYSITVNLRKNDTDDLLTFVMNVSIKAETIPSIKAMFIGDSFIDSGYIQSELLNKMGSALTLYGTREFTNIPDYNDANHSGLDEGRTSWRLWNYCNSASYNGMTNPFFNNNTFDFAYYMSNNPAFSDVTDVFLLTGPNDSGWGDYAFQTSYNTVVNSIKSYNANIRIHVLMPITCFCEGYAWGTRNHNGGNEYRYNEFGFGKILVDTFDSVANVFVVPTHMDFNKNYDFPTTEVASSDHNPTLMKVFNDNVHPSRYGYYGMSGMIFGDIVANCN